MKKKILGWTPFVALVVMILGLTSCEQEDRFVGYNIFGDGSGNYNKAYLDLKATTLMPDTLRADRLVLRNATIGVYDDATLGKTKSAFLSQVRLATLNPTFGENPIVDSVVLFLPVFESEDTIATQYFKKKVSYSLSNTDTSCTISDTLTQYETRHLIKLDSIYGNTNSTMTLQVNRLIGSMGTINMARYSNESLQVAELFGSKEINASAYKSMVYQHSVNGTDSTSISTDSSPIIKVHLDGMKSFIQNNVVNNSSSTNLSDQISFINNVLNGIQISVAEENGFFFNFNQSGAYIVAYVSGDNSAFEDENGNGRDDDEEDCPIGIVNPRTTTEFNLLLGSGSSSTDTRYYNVAQSYITHEAGSITYNQEGLATNYIQGLGGSKVKVSFDPEQIEAIRDSVNNNDWVITEARLKVYPDMNAQGNLPLPEYIYAFNLSQGKTLPDYGDGNFTSVAGIQGFPANQISVAYNSDTGYYLLRITKLFKEIVEENAAIDDLALEMGNYFLSGTDYFFTPASAYLTSRAYNPYKLAMVGTNPSSANQDKKFQLEIYYYKK